eukprot:1889264-Rhodomonas_salina.1
MMLASGTRGSTRSERLYEAVTAMMLRARRTIAPVAMMLRGVGAYPGPLLARPPGPSRPGSSIAHLSTGHRVAVPSGRAVAAYALSVPDIA